MSSPTPHQQRAIGAGGNVLVVAGAGTGKTRTLVERCLARVCSEANPVSLDHVLMVTFTEAAAAEIRKRLREELEKRAAADADNSWLAEQSALVDTARISTLHSFCLQVVREHFYQLGLDPQLTVLAEAQSRLLARETLDRLLEKHYAGGTAAAEAVQQLILEHGRGWDQPIRELVLRVHNYTQTLRDPEGWFREQKATLGAPRPERWEQWLREGFVAWMEFWLPVLRDQPKDNPNAQRCAEALCSLTRDASRESIAAVLTRILEADKEWPGRKKRAFRGPIEEFLDEAAFLHTLAADSDGNDPLMQDWEWVRPQMTALLELAREFSREFARAKRELAALDFHDLEQFALQVLWDRATNQPTAGAGFWRKQLDLVFVDEYQDINEAQDTILRALGREGGEANRFLVGDVKQSIYRFRLANPRIFQRYAHEWGKGGIQVVALSDNFRSHESILNFVNGLFAGLMRKEVGGVDYDAPQRLKFGAPEQRKYFAANAGESRVELHLCLTGSDETETDDGTKANDPANLSTAEKEARLVAARMRELKRQAFQIWDRDKNRLRPVDWRDMAVLLRSPRGKAESYAKAFDEFGVPLVVARGGFFESLEISDLLSLLRLLDNPLQDLPLLAVLRSPLAGLTLEEMATIRCAQRRGYFWTALRRFHLDERQAESNPESSTGKMAAPTAETAVSPASGSGSRRLGAVLGPGLLTGATRQKVAKFLKRFATWRALARQGCLSHCLETVLAETHYEAWLLTQARGAQRRANVQRLLAMTREFDQFQRQGLFRFLTFVEAQLEAEVQTEPAIIATEDAVQLMSIHQSKGLEFPVAVVADLGKRFNFDDLKDRVILDEEFGLCPKVKPPHTSQLYPSLPYWLARRRQKRETLGEESRLLYVGLTRACDKLILTGAVSRKTVLAWRADSATGEFVARQILEAKSYLDWLGHWLPGATGHAAWTSSGQNSLLAWRVHEEDDGPAVDRPAAPDRPTDSTESAELIDPGAISSLRQKLDWRYPFDRATREPAKTSVSTLRRRLRDATDDEAKPLFPGARSKPQAASRANAAGGELTAADRGTAHHAFLEMMSLDRVGSSRELEAEAQRLEAEGVLSTEEVKALDLAAVAAFWQSDPGRRIFAHRVHVHREIPFLAGFRADDLAQLGLLAGAAELDGEFFVVQGFVDLAVILPTELWLVDFKTDAVRVTELEEKRSDYERQLKLYGLALQRIYHRPVTALWLHFLALKQTVPLLTETS